MPIGAIKPVNLFSIVACSVFARILMTELYHNSQIDFVKSSTFPSYLVSGFVYGTIHIWSKWLHWKSEWVLGNGYASSSRSSMGPFRYEPTILTLPVEFSTNYTKMLYENANIGISVFTAWKQKNSSDKMLPPVGIEPKPLIASDSMSNTIPFNTNLTCAA